MEFRQPESTKQPRPLAATAWHEAMRGLQALDIRDILGVLRRRKRTLITCVVVITGLTTAVVYSLTPQYAATNSVIIDAREPELSDVKSIITGASVGTEMIESQVSVILSRDFAERVIRTLKLYERPEFNPALREPSGLSRHVAEARAFVKRQFEVLAGPDPVRVPPVEEQFEQERVQVINALIDKLQVEPRKGTWVLDLTARSESPELAARLANTAADLYLVHQLDAKYEATKRVSEWLTGRLSDLRADLGRAEDAVAAYRNTAGLLQGAGDVTLAQQQISDVNARLVEARLRRAEVEARLRQAEELLRSPEGADAAGEVLQSPIIQNLVAQQTLVMREIAQLSAMVGENHPDLKRARAEARDLKAMLIDEIGKIVESLRNEASIARSGEQDLEQRLAQLESKVAALNSSEAELRILEREAETNRLLYESFLSSFKEAAEQEKIQQSDAHIISRADAPLEPVFPNKPIFISLGAISSLFIGFILIGLMEQFDRGVRSMEQVYRDLGVPCLGLVPAISKFRIGRRSPEDYVVAHPASAYAEAVRSIRAGIFLMSSGQRPRVVAITSARGREGKTSIAISMARLNAMGERRTILLDCDLRKPEVYKRLRARQRVGVTDYLMGEATLADIVQKDARTGLDYIVAGRPTAGGAELWSSDRLEALLDELGRQYNLAILDAPPIMAVSDARLVSRVADKTLVVVRWGDTPKNVAQLALRQLAESGVNIAGVAISRVDVRRNAQYGFGDSETFTGPYMRYYSG